MVWILVIGAVIAIINVVLTYNELIPWLSSLKQLKHYTETTGGIYNRLMYIPRFIYLLPKAKPLALDAIIAVVAGSIGFSGGVYGALIGLTIGFTASLLVKVHRKFVDPKIQVAGGTWKS